MADPDPTAAPLADAPAADDADAPPDPAAPTDAPAAGEGGDAATLGPDDIEALLAAADAGSVELPPEEDAGTDPDDADLNAAAVHADGPAPRGEPAAGRTAPGTSIPVGGQVEKLLEEVEAEVRRGRRPVLGAGEEPPDALGSTAPLRLEPFAEGAASGTAAGEPGGGGLGALDDVELDLRIELGRTEMALEEVVGLRDGSVVALDKLAGDPVDILVNGRLVARGEVLVLNDNFCVRVAEILAPDR